MQFELPQSCFSVEPDTGSLICIKRGERGSCPSDWNTDDAERNRKIADSLNQQMGISYAVECAFVAGSILNWNIPRANPQHFLDHAEYQESRLIQGHIRHGAISVYYPIEGRLYRYLIGGREQHYLSLYALSPAILGNQSDRTILPELICGKPLAQVEAICSQNGTYTLHLFPHCFAPGPKEITSEYQINMRMQVGKQELTMGYHEETPAQYATWLRVSANDKLSLQFDWNHNFDKRESAIEDFCECAYSMYQQLSQRNAQPSQSNKRQELER